MNFEKELKDKGFEQINNGSWSYDFSDFELLEFTADEHITPDGKIMLKIGDIRLWDPMQDIEHATINYELYYNNVDEFLKLLELIHYKI